LEDVSANFSAASTALFQCRPKIRAQLLLGILGSVSTPTFFLLSLARHYAEETVAAVLWNANNADLAGLCGMILHPKVRRISKALG